MKKRKAEASRSNNSFFIIFIIFSIIMPTGAAWADLGNTHNYRARIDHATIDEIRQNGRARVIIMLQEPGSDSREEAISRAQNSLLSTLKADDFLIQRRLKRIPVISGTLGPAGLKKLERNPLVSSISNDIRMQAHLAETVPVVVADWAQSIYGLTGDGITVAVLDTGIDTDHPDLQDDIIAQQCFTTGMCPPYYLDTGTVAEDDNGHGTHVSGIITSNGTVGAPGIAPNAKIAAVKVLDYLGGGWLSDWAAGLDWVLAHRAQYNIKIVNLSLGSVDLYTGSCDTYFSPVFNAISQLVSEGVIVLSSTGNNGSPDSTSLPCCYSSVVGVGATYDADLGREPDTGTFSNGCYDASSDPDTVTCFSNSGSELDILAPGGAIIAPYVGGGLAIGYGTSQASPVAAGVAALMLEKINTLTPAMTEYVMKSTGIAVTDSKNGLQYPRLNALAAVDALVDSDEDGVLDDGDLSGTAGDSPCTGGVATGCDDNCPAASNFEQGDSDADGLGDACDPTTPPLFRPLQTNLGPGGGMIAFEDNMTFFADSQNIMMIVLDPDYPDDGLGWASEMGVAQRFVSYRESGQVTWSAETELVPFGGVAGYYARWMWVYPKQIIPSDGLYDVRLAAEDAAGNRQELVIRVRIDTTPPAFLTVTTNPGGGGTYVNLTNGMVVGVNESILFTSEDPFYIDDGLAWASPRGVTHRYVSYRLTGQSIWSNELVAAGLLGNPGSYGIWTWLYPEMLLPGPGSYDLRFAIEDDYGNRGEAVFQIGVTSTP